MKNCVKRTVGAVLVSSFLLGMTGCSIFDKANKLCNEIGDEFIQAALEREIEDMADLCIDDDEAMEYLGIYASEVDQIDCLLEKATFKATDKSCSTKDGKGKITYVITLPDWDVALDEDPEDADEFVDLIDDLEETTEIEVELSFKLKKDNWYISNPDDFAEDFYGELYDIDFPFESPLASQLEEARWFFFDGGNQDNPTYDVGCDQIDLQIWLPNDSGVHYTVEYNGRVIFSDYGSDAWVHDYEISSDFIYEAGVYTITFLDSQDRPIYSDTCIVQ